MKRKFNGEVQRAHSLIRIKEMTDGEERHIEGIATTPTPDRVGDIVDPMGASFADEIPLQLFHDHTKPVGTVKFGRPTKKGIPFKASIPVVAEPGIVQDRVNEAWHSLKYRLIGAVSIGFRVLREKGEYMLEWMEEEGGFKFLKTEILELSLVTVPAQPDAVITGIKSIDMELRAALGIKTQRRVVRLDKSTASALANHSTQEETSVKNLQESIRAFLAKRTSLHEKMSALMEKAEAEGRSLDETEEDEYNDLEKEIEACDKHLGRLEKLEKLQVKKAKVIVPDADDEVEPGSAARDPRIVTVERKLEPGIEFARYVMCLGAAKGFIPSAYEIAKQKFKDTPRVVNVLKAAVAGGTTSDATWAGPLLEYNQFAGDFVEYLRPQTIIGKFGTGGIPSLRRVPFNINIRGQTSGGAGYWVGQGKAKPLTKFDYENVYLGFFKVANIAVLTEELVRFSNPNAEVLVRDALRDALLERMDTDFVDPAFAGSANVSPASITYNVTPIPSSGGDADAIREDVRLAMSAYVAANITPSTGVWIMTASTALALSLMRNALGQKEFPDITMMGGTFEGLPVITSEYVDHDSNGALVILVNASDIYLADDGLVTVDASREASLQMDNEPTNDATSGTGASMVSMFQTNSVAIRAERYINWKKRRAAAVQVIEDAAWGTTS